MNTSSKDVTTVQGDVDGASRLRTLQRILFEPINGIASQELYVKIRKGRLLKLSRSALTVSDYSTVSTRTYFGRFPAAYYQRWTEVRTVSVRASVTGRGRLRVVASDDLDRERTVGSVNLAEDTTTEVSIPVAIDKFLDGGFIWVEADSAGGPLTVSDLRFESESTAVAKTISVVICTYNRPRDCAETLRTLASDKDALAVVDRVLVIDQGTDLVRDQDGYAQVAAVLGEKLEYIRQANLGGAGGFTRGIYESTAADGRVPGDIVLMDDDIVLEPESLVRMTAFSSRTIDPVLVGAQMLYLYHPNVLHTSAEDADLDSLRAGVAVHEREAGLDLTKKLPYRWAEGGYNAWWMCLIPTSVVGRIGYPLPVFFQWDDIEYGLRARGQQIPTVTLPGAAVWHADFSLKDRDDWSRYFSYRNSLIVASLHGNWRTGRVAKVLAKHLLEMIMSLHYGLAATTLLAIDGFLAGPDAIRNGSAEVLSEIRSVRSHYPDTVRHRPEEMVETGLFSLPAIHSGGYPRMPRLILIKRSLWQLFGLNRRVGKIASADSNWYHSSQFRRAIVTDAALDSFRVRSFDAKTARNLIDESARTLLRLIRHGSAAAAAWRSARGELTSRDTWSRIFRDATVSEDQ